MKHPTDHDLIERLDQPDTVDNEIEAHLRECEACRTRSASIEALFAELKAQPEALAEEAIAASRADIAKRIREPRVTPLRRGRWWIPAAAVASIGLVLVSLSVRRDAEPSLTLIEEARLAAEAAIAEVGPIDEIDTAWTTDGPIDEALSLELEFSQLSIEEQAAILDAMSNARIEL